jgi:hypothetical protein
MGKPPFRCRLFDWRASCMVAVLAAHAPPPRFPK